MKTALSVLIFGVVVLTALAAISAFGFAFASIGMSGGADLTQLAGELFAFSRVGLLAVIVLVAVYAVAFVRWGGEAQAPQSPPVPPPGDNISNSMD